MTTKDFYDLLQYKRYAVMHFSDFLSTPEELVRQSFSLDWLNQKIDILIDNELLHRPMVIPLVQWQVGHTVLAVHSYNVSSIALLLGYKFNLNAKELHDLMLAAIFHDIGKAFISPAIIDKNGKLSPTEASVMRQHPKIGEIFLKEHYPEFGDEVISAVAMHHEKLDGSGYYGYTGDEIGLYARIITVADIFCAVSEERTYHHARSIDESLNVLTRTPGLDPDCVSLCCQLSQKYVYEAKLIPITDAESDIMNSQAPQLTLVKS